MEESYPTVGPGTGRAFDQFGPVLLKAKDARIQVPHFKTEMVDRPLVQFVRFHRRPVGQGGILGGIAAGFRSRCNSPAGSDLRGRRE